MRRIDPLVVVYLIGAGIAVLIVCGGVAVLMMLAQAGV